MFNEYDNVRNPMLGAYLLWSFVLGYFSEKNEATPLEELFIVLPMTLKITDNGNDGIKTARVSHVFCFRYEC